MASFFFHRCTEERNNMLNKDKQIIKNTQESRFYKTYCMKTSYSLGRNHGPQINFFSKCKCSLYYYSQSSHHSLAIAGSLGLQLPQQREGQAYTLRCSREGHFAKGLNLPLYNFSIPLYSKAYLTSSIQQQLWAASDLHQEYETQTPHYIKDRLRHKNSPWRQPWHELVKSSGKNSY